MSRSEDEECVHISEIIDAVAHENNSHISVLDDPFLRQQSTDLFIQKSHPSAVIKPRVLCFDLNSKDIHGREINSKQKNKVKGCDYCGLVLPPSKRAAHLVKIHGGAGEKPFNCELCGQGFTQNTPYRLHLKRHIGDIPYKCRICSKGFPNASSMRGHEVKVHNRKLEFNNLVPVTIKVPFNPPVNYRNKTSLVGSSISPILTWQMPVGDIKPPSKEAKKPNQHYFAATSNSNERGHRRSRLSSDLQVDEKEVQCTVAQCTDCGLTLKHPSKIQAHLRTHTGEKPYKCFCGLNFVSKYTLKIHARRFHTDSDERLFKCTWECSKSFVSLAARNEHERIVHVGIKRYKCTFLHCTRLFTRRIYLVKHLARVHQADPDVLLQNKNRSLRKYSANNNCGQSDGSSSSSILISEGLSNPLIIGEQNSVSCALRKNDFG